MMTNTAIFTITYELNKNSRSSINELHFVIALIDYF